MGHYSSERASLDRQRESEKERERDRIEAERERKERRESKVSEGWRGYGLLS